MVNLKKTIFGTAIYTNFPSNLPIQFKWVQFSIRQVFAMSIN